MSRRPEVEPLSQARWARVERELFDRVDREGLGAPAAEASPRRPALRMMTGFVMAGAAAAIVGAVSWEALRPAHVDPSGLSRVATEGTASRVEFGEASLDVGPHSAVLLEGDAVHGVTVVLDHGDVDCEVAPRRERPPFMVRSGEITVRVVGTHFRVTRDADATHVAVESGTVEVDEHGHQTYVHAGETWPAPAPAPAVTTPAPAGSTAAPPPATRTASATRATSGREAHAVAPPPETATAAAATVPEPSPQERYEHALTLEASQPDVSLETYRELAAGSGPWAMNALFAEGRLESDRGHTPQARQLLDEYLLRFPTGPNAQDARELRARLE